MGWRNSPRRYGSLAIALHWLMLLLIIAVYACIELREVFPRGSDPRAMLKSWHFTLGLSVLLLATLRLAVHLFGPTPRIEPEPPRVQRLAARAVHVALYAFMLLQPLMGWLVLSAEATPVPFYGLTLPALTGADERLADDIEDLHESVGRAGYFLIGAHAAAALFHHFFLRDNTLRRMLPRSWTH